jgi:predicted RNA-binding protein (TIGR00451 family)
MKILRALSNAEKRKLGIKAKQVFLAEWKRGVQVILVDKKPLYMKYGDQVLPTLHGNWQSLPKVFVDRGAAPFILKGADVLRPGIERMEEFQKGQGVAIMLGESVLGIGVALVSSEEAKAMEKGKIVKTLHVKGDELWNFEG